MRTSIAIDLIAGISDLLPEDADETKKIVLTAVATLAVALVVFFARRIWSAVGRAAGFGWRRLRIERARELDYRRRLAKALRQLQILQMSEAKELSAVYIPLELGRWTSPSLRRSEQASVTSLGIKEALETLQRFTILGYPGAGKTTITSYAAAVVADRSLRIGGKSYFPLYLTLRHVKDVLESDIERSLRDITIAAAESLGFARAGSFVDRKLEDGECLVVLDGFDELSDREGRVQQRLAMKVKEFSSGIHDDNRVIVTSRPTGYEPAWFPGFTVLEVTELELEHAQTFIRGWFGDGAVAQADKLSDLLAENERLAMLVRNPLMLAIVCFVYGASDGQEPFLPHDRVDLYERCVHALTEEWDRTRGISREARFTPEQIEEVLQYVAYEALRDGMTDFSRTELLTSVRRNMRRAKLRRYRDTDFVAEAMDHTGLLREKGLGKIGFVHLVFLEYLAAQVIAQDAERGSERGTIEAELSDVLRNLADTRWTEPITLAAGILRGQTQLITLLYDAYSRNPTDDILLLLAGCFRDADAIETDLAADLLAAQDEILTRVVNMAAAA